MNISVFLVAVPLLIAFLTMVIGKFKKDMVLGGALVNFLLAAGMTEGDVWIGGFAPPYGISLHVDTYAYWSAVIVNGVFLMVMAISMKKLEKPAPILLVALAGVNGAILTGDLFNLFVFLEIITIAGVAIASTRGGWLKTFNYLVIGSVGASLYLLGIALLYSQYGTLNMADMSMKMSMSNLHSVLPIVFIFAGLAVEVKLLPFNGWVRGILEDADALVGGIFGSVYSGVMLIVFGRVFMDVVEVSGHVRTAMIILAVVTLLFGEAAAFKSKNIRQVLLYSSIAQAGLAAVLFIYSLGTLALLVVLGQMIAKFILYGLTGHIADTAGTDEIGDLKGLFAKHKLDGLAFTAASLSLAGLPLFFGFFVKINVLSGLFQQGNYLLPGILLLAALVEGAYFVSMNVTLWNGGEEGEYAKEELLPDNGYSVPKIATVLFIVSALTLVIMGIVPQGAIKEADNAASNLKMDNAVEHYIGERGLN